MKHKKKMNRQERIADYINQRMEEIFKGSQCTSRQSPENRRSVFLALFLEIIWERQMDSASFIAWSVVMWLSGIGYAFHLLQCGEKKEYEVTEGTVYRDKGEKNACSGVSVKWNPSCEQESRLCY